MCNSHIAGLPDLVPEPDAPRANGTTARRRIALAAATLPHEPQLKWLYDQPPAAALPPRGVPGTSPVASERWRVYDPVLGMIPRETHAHWQSQIAEADKKREERRDLPTPPLPPVRNYA
jgi:hypothetical protein